MRVRVYIDGFNLYHSVDELKDDKLKWLDVRKLAAQFLRPNEEIDKVLFFTALPTYLIREARDQVKSQKAAEKIARHRLYIKALEACGTEVNPGTFKAKPAKCYKCKTE